MNPLVDALFALRGPEAHAVERGRAAARAPVAIVTLPIGPAQSARAAAQALANRTFNRVLIVGLCGAVTDGLGIGDIIVPDSCLDPSGAQIACDEGLVRAVRARLSMARGGRILTGDRIITHARHKRSVGERYGADAVDMESFALLATLRDRGIPAAVVRVVSDTVDDDLPDLESALRRDGSLDPLRLALALVRKPRAGFAFAYNAMSALRVVTAVSTIVLRENASDGATSAAGEL